MTRKLLTTTSVLAMLAGGTLAAGAGVAAQDETGKLLFSADTKMEMKSEAGYFTADESQILASTLLGQSVYSNASGDAEAIGDVNDVVMGPNGMAEAVVIGVGGFVGLGEKHVAVDFDKIRWVDRDGRKWLVLETTKEALEAAPEFKYASLTPKAEAPAEPMMKDQTAAMQPAEPASDMAAKPDKPMTDEAAVMLEGWTPVIAGDLSADQLIGARVYNTPDDNIGEISDVIVATNGDFEAYIVDVGGFLGIGEKSVALDASALEILRDGDGDLRAQTSFTQEQLEAHPAYDPELYKTNRDAAVLR